MARTHSQARIRLDQSIKEPTIIRNALVKIRFLYRFPLPVAMAILTNACGGDVVETNADGAIKHKDAVQISPATPTRGNSEPIATSDSNRPGSDDSLKHPFPEIPRNRNDLDFEDDPFGPTSVAEQHWLDTHGFPNARQWETYSTASEYLLERAANSGDAVAKTMLDTRRLPVDPDAKTRLFFAGAEGNIFALNSLASYMVGSKDGDLQVGYSLSRVAEMRGDTRIAMARDVMMPRSLSEIERMQAEADALRMNHQLDGIYRDKHGSLPPPVVRRPVIELEN